MRARDIFQSINELEPDALERIIDRLEYRGRDPLFVQMRQAYLERMGMPPDADVLDLGCGTGVVARAIAARNGFRGRVTGVDYGIGLIEAARRFAEAEGVASRIDFSVGNAQALREPDASYDAVILHTLVSHVPDPVAVIAEGARVARPGGAIAIFDGDYGSLILSTGEATLDAEMAEVIRAAAITNAHVMRDIPKIAQEVGLEISAFLPGIQAEAGGGAYFSTMAETYVPAGVKAGIIDAAKAEQWLHLLRAALAEARFFGSCNYHAYVARKPA